MNFIDISKFSNKLKVFTDRNLMDKIRMKPTTYENNGKSSTCKLISTKMHALGIYF